MQISVKQAAKTQPKQDKSFSFFDFFFLFFFFLSPFLTVYLLFKCRFVT